MNLLTAMKQALDAIKHSTEYRMGVPGYEALSASLSSAITEMERVEPAGYFVYQDFGGWQQVAKEFEHHTDITPLYFHPAQSRDAIIEECAGVCEARDIKGREVFAAAIRELKGKK